MDVCPQQVLICKLHAGRQNRSCNHQLWPSEEILGVRAEGGAIREHKGRLAASPGASAPLRVVCRVWRNIAHVHYG